MKEVIMETFIGEVKGRIFVAERPLHATYLPSSIAHRFANFEASENPSRFTT
jgi:hypothetical protein